MSFCNNKCFRGAKTQEISRKFKCQTPRNGRDDILINVLLQANISILQYKEENNLVVQLNSAYWCRILGLLSKFSYQG